MHIEHKCQIEVSTLRTDWTAILLRNSEQLKESVLYVFSKSSENYSYSIRLQTFVSDKIYIYHLQSIRSDPSPKWENENNFVFIKVIEYKGVYLSEEINNWNKLVLIRKRWAVSKMFSMK